MFHTQNVLRRIKKFMPYRSGAMYKVTVTQTDIRKPEIVTETPGARYLFRGKVMIDLQFSKGKNPQAGPRWDKALSANEGKAMAADLQRFIDKRSGAK